MPTYAYRCRDCSDTFEVRRSMSEAAAPASCPQGHADTVKLLTTVGLTSSSSGAGATAAPEPRSGGCCGGGCCG